MAEVLLICRFVARTGMEFQLRALLQGMLAPTHKPNRDVNGMNFMNQTRGGACICAKHGKVKLRSIRFCGRRSPIRSVPNSWRRRQEIQSLPKKYSRRLG